MQTKPDEDNAPNAAGAPIETVGVTVLRDFATGGCIGVTLTINKRGVEISRRDGEALAAMIRAALENA